MAINITDINTEFGLYYKEGSASVKDLIVALRQPSETDKFFTYIPTKSTRIEKGLATITSVLQGYQDTFTPSGSTTFTPRVIDLDQLKIDLKENPSKLENSWLGFLAGLAPNDRSKWPFIKWLIEVMVIPQSISDWELKGIYSAVKGTLTPGTVLPIEQALNGLKKQFNLAVTAGDLDPLVVGAAPTDPVDYVDYVEAFAAKIPHLYRANLQPIVMSHSNIDRYKQGMDRKYNMNYDKTDVVKVMHTNLTVAGVASMEGSNKMWTTLKNNAIIAVKKPELQTVFEVEKYERMVSIYTDFHKVATIVNWAWLFTNDVELS